MPNRNDELFPATVADATRLSKPAGGAVRHYCEKCGREYECSSTVCGGERAEEKVGKCADCLNGDGSRPAA